MLTMSALLRKMTQRYQGNHTAQVETQRKLLVAPGVTSRGSKLINNTRELLNYVTRARYEKTFLGGRCFRSKHRFVAERLRPKKLITTIGRLNFLVRSMQR